VVTGQLKQGPAWVDGQLVFEAFDVLAARSRSAVGPEVDRRSGDVEAAREFGLRQPAFVQELGQRVS